ncbi:MAG: hypothetical protein IID45_00550 [Planctomycetes bacterium]|nr:hypothetical protein [Planctomycetota bacterium]
MSDHDSDKNTERQTLSPPPRPKRVAGSNPPPRPKRDTGSPPPRPKRDNGSSSTGRSRKLSKRTLIFGGVGLLCVIAIVAGLSSLFGLGGPTSTTAADYTSAEVKEIFDLLRNDPGCRDTRLGDSFSQDIISLELLNAVLGQPVSKAGSGHHLIWVYRTSDGTATITPFAVFENVADSARTVPSLDMQGNVKIVGLNTDHPVNREALKQTIIRIKSRFDDRNGVEFAAQLEEKHAKDQAAEEAEGRRRDEQERKKRDAAHAQMAAERAARTARQQEKRRKQDAEVAKRKRFLEVQPQAEREFSALRDALPLGAERNAVTAQRNEWVRRRIEAITSAREKDRDWKNLPLPDKRAVSVAASNGKPIPVTGSGATKPVTTNPQKPEKKTPDKNTRGNVATKKTESKQGAEKKKTTAKRKTRPTTQPKKPITKNRKRRPAKTRNAAVNKKVSLTAPYPASYKGAPRDKISVQYAVIEIAKQVGLRYDFKSSYANTNPICRRWVRPRIRNQTYQKALVSILRPVGLTYRITNGVIVLRRR